MTDELMPSAHAVSRALDKRRIRLRAERAAAHYETHDAVPREIGTRLLEHLEPIRIAPGWVLDAGAASGRTSAALVKRYRRARVVSLDHALGMLQKARQKQPRWLSRAHPLLADAERLPLREQSMDLVLANLLPSWFAEPDRLLNQFRSVLRPGGLLMFSALGPDTLRELRECLADSRQEHVHPFIDMHDLGDALVRAGFADVVMETERLTVFYRSAKALWQELRALGATNALAAQSRALRTPRWLATLEQRYEEMRRPEGLPATCEVVYAHAWVPVQREQIVAFEGR